MSAYWEIRGYYIRGKIGDKRDKRGIFRTH